ncbi:kunitz trypsin inhibitor 1 [Raphanus sativus]|uniref:Kunitz trypsin inhibitor 4-like n=1 Tax=Raphanus sativus TaxID=3726 RepID=A0A6J0L3A0_RAPSA|nr:kunitz trypsin inhibitor 4-like [Raphanus sativus]KAJ4875013.1 kunitz trypsin inhibitor 1 [Raphanus sativus]
MNRTFYFFLALTAVLATNTYGQVLDIDGDTIFRGSYYVLPVIRGQGGGLTLRGRGGEICPLDIVQKSSEVDEGIPVKFSNWRIKVAFVPESQNLNIETDIAATICIQSTYWQVGEFDEERKKYFVVAGPQDSLKSFFQIEKSGDDAYKFVFCPPALETGRPRCRNVGIFVDEKGVRRLALTSKPFLVMFKKAKVTETSSRTM